MFRHPSWPRLLLACTTPLVLLIAGCGGIALFHLPSIVTVRGFGDGNKRAGHAACAVCLIKNTRQFKAPSLVLENSLFRMDN